VAHRVRGAVHLEHDCARRHQGGSLRVLAREARVFPSRKPHRRLGLEPLELTPGKDMLIRIVSMLTKLIEKLLSSS
jgi:hypothetical protein